MDEVVTNEKLIKVHIYAELVQLVTITIYSIGSYKFVKFLCIILVIVLNAPPTAAIPYKTLY